MSNVDDRFSSPPPVPRGRRTRPVRIGFAAWTPTIILIAVIFFPLWFWFFCRIEPRPGEIAIVIRKAGNDLPSGQILATEPGQKGILPDVLAEGRYFRNPYTWGWEIRKITDIPAGKLGVLTRLYGDDLPPGRIIAADRSKGIVRDVLSPGKYRINPYAYDLETFDAITVRPGYVGVVASLVGRDVLNDKLAPEERNTFLVAGDMKGVQPAVLDPGTYYLNPYVVSVVEVTLQSQRFEMSGEDAITFLTADGFTITVEGTIEYALLRDTAAMLTQQIGDLDDILKKIILPRARGFSRIEGSKNPAKNYITGDTRQQFQDNLQQHLQTLCRTWGIDIRSVLIRNITPPDEIAAIIREREVAVQTSRKYEQQIEQARSKAELTRQEMLAVQNKEKVEAETAQIRAVILAKQDQAVKVTEANRELEVAKLERDASLAQADAIGLKADADKEVIRMRNEAEAGVLKTQVDALGGGMNLARNAFYQRVGPRVSSILSGDQGDGLGALFLPYLPPRKEVAP